MLIPFYNPTPAPAGIFENEDLPLKNANLLSKFMFQWVTPILKVGYTRPLEPDDLWKLTPDLQCQTNADRLHEHLMQRTPPSKRLGYKRPSSQHLTSGNDDQSQSQGGTDPETNSLSVTDEKQKGAKVGAIVPEHVHKYGKRNAQKIADGLMAEEDGDVYDMSLWMAMYWTFCRQWWIAVGHCGVTSALRITAPLVTKLLLAQLTRAHAWHAAIKSDGSTEGLVPPKSVGYGIGLALALTAMQYFGSLLNYYGTNKASLIGFRLRSACVDLVARKSMRLSGKSRLEMTNGRLVTLISSDCSNLDWAMRGTVSIPILPPMIIAGVALLIINLGYSALVGLGVLCLSAPIQGIMYKKFAKYRLAQEQYTDKRVRILTEILGNIRAVKLYAYERFFGDKVAGIRRKELKNQLMNSMTRAGLMAMMDFIPILAAILTFITYGLTAHTLDAAVIFSSLQWFDQLGQPLSRLPFVLVSVTDMQVAMKRISRMLLAEELESELDIRQEAEYAIDIRGDFQFDGAPVSEGLTDSDKTDKNPQIKDKDKASSEAPEQIEGEKQRKKRNKRLGRPADYEEPDDEGKPPFALRNIALEIPRGALVCVVGRVGTGKTALLLSMINEVKKLRGHVRFGGTVSYVPQQAWVQSGSVRDNITFSSKTDEVDQDRIRLAIDACALKDDIAEWEDGELTIIGEKGITLSGGQRQRICLARAAYDDSDIFLLDDPLSAVDANVGHHLLENCILEGPMADRTRILVTHHLEVLPKADMVLVLDRVGNNDAQIVQHGSYVELREKAGIFQDLMAEFGTSDIASKQTSDVKTDKNVGLISPINEEPSGSAKAISDIEEQIHNLNDESKPQHQSQLDSEPESSGGGKFLLDEERVRGTVSKEVYLAYGRALGSWWWVILCSSLLVATQVASVGNSLFLGFWSGSTIPGFSQGSYMGLYAGFGGAQAFLTFAAWLTMALAGMRASFNMFNGAWSAVMYSPTSWHDRTPTGRIISRLSKDITMLDGQFTWMWTYLIETCLTIVGSFALIVYTYPWLGLLFLPLICTFYLCFTFYTQTSRELKRVQSLIRSGWYTAFSEQLAGSSVIRAFGQQSNFQKKLQEAINKEDQACVLTIACQSWLSVRLEAMSDSVILLIALIGVVYRDHVSPDKFGVVVTYALSTGSAFTTLVSLMAQCEQEMNSVERISYYNTLEPEAPPKLPTDPEPSQWPTEGNIEFNNVEVRYRPESPLVLKGLNLSIKPGEKVGIIGRTGAGKSSIAQALFRTVELCNGDIRVDGVDLKEIGLETLRSRLAIIPQDAFLFAGTIRDNIDPASVRTDAELNDALNLIRTHPRASNTLREKFKLDAAVSAEGSNFSAGEKQLLSLVRALARKCKVLLLDEATSSVDPETDALIQQIIQREFGDVTLISIAHRLQTVAYYDRVLVLEKGIVAEYDSPLELFDKQGGIFRSLCEKKGLGREELLRIRAEANLPTV